MATHTKTIENKALLRYLPSVDVLIEDLRSKSGEGSSDPILASAAREAIDIQRRRILAGEMIENGSAGQPYSDTTQIRAALHCKILREANDLLIAGQTPDHRHVINATGIVLHTNLGRAPLSEAACQALIEVSRSYSNLEYDLRTGQRGKRGGAIESLLQILTGAESAVVVNNNAAAVMFSIRMMAEGKEAIVSRGELVEIGGSFRIPDIIAQSGSAMVEVGSTNKTHLSDYERAIGQETGLLFKAHTSNFRIIGFTEEVPREELAALAHARGLPILEDLGSGCLANLPGIPNEPTISASVKAGIDVITFSGDKLLGGPQAGIIIGKSVWVDKLKNHPMMRVLRLDKLALAALEATLRTYLDPDRAMRELPALRMLAEEADSTQARAESLLEALGKNATLILRAELTKSKGRVGGGAMPLTELKSWAVSLKPEGISSNRMDSLLRRSDPPAITRIRDDHLLLDMRCVNDEEIESLARIVREMAEYVS